MRAGFVTILVTFCLCTTTLAQVGEPVCTFGIRVKHGALTLIDNPAVPVPADIKINDGDPEDFVHIGQLVPNAPVILKLVSDGGPSESFRTLHFYLLVPVDLLNPDIPGPVSLFDPAGAANVSVEIHDMKFRGTSPANPLIVPGFPAGSFFVSYMRDKLSGAFYLLPGANAFNQFGHGVSDIQVPSERYLDAAPSPYQFLASPGLPSGWIWNNMVNPGPATPVASIVGFPIASGSPPGFVFELGLGVAVTGQKLSPIDFVQILLGLSPSPAAACISDFNNDGVVNALDIQGYVQFLLT